MLPIAPAWPLHTPTHMLSPYHSIQLLYHHPPLFWSLLPICPIVNLSPSLAIYPSSSMPLFFRTQRWVVLIRSSYIGGISNYPDDIWHKPCESVGIMWLTVFEEGGFWYICRICSFLLLEQKLIWKQKIYKLKTAKISYILVPSMALNTE